MTLAILQKEVQVLGRTVSRLTGYGGAAALFLGILVTVLLMFINIVRAGNDAEHDQMQAQQAADHDVLIRLDGQVRAQTALLLKIDAKIPEKP